MPNTSTMIHCIKSIGGFTYHPDNSNSLGFTLTDTRGETYSLTFFGMSTEKAEDFYNRNTKPLEDNQGRIEKLEKTLASIAYGLSENPQQDAKNALCEKGNVTPKAEDCFPF